MPEPTRRTFLTATAAAAPLIGLRRPASGPQDDLSLPSSRIARKATQLITRDEEAYLRNHSVRSFLFGRAAAEQSGLRAGQDYDVEIVFLICVLHDTGLTADVVSDQRFEVAGADFAAKFLEDNGIRDRRVDTVWDGIALHTSRTITDSPVFQRRRPPEIGIAQRGIAIDLLGGPGDLPPGYADAVFAVYPRLGGARTLTDAVEAQALANPRKAPPLTFPGEILHQRHPELPYPTWDAILATGGWHD